MANPFFSIIVPTYNRGQQLNNCLEALARLAYPGGLNTYDRKYPEIPAGSRSYIVAGSKYGRFPVGSRKIFDKAAKAHMRRLGLRGSPTVHHVY